MFLNLCIMKCYIDVHIYIHTIDIKNLLKSCNVMCLHMHTQTHTHIHTHTHTHTHIKLFRIHPLRDSKTTKRIPPPGPKRKTFGTKPL